MAQRRAARWAKYYVRWPEELVPGRFREIGGHGDMLTQRMKDERRNILAEALE